MIRSFLRVGLYTLLVLSNLLQFIDLSLVKLFLLLAIIVYIPEIVEKSYGFSSYYSGLIAGSSTVISFQYDQGITAMVFIIPWLVYCLVYTYKTNPYRSGLYQVENRSTTLLILSSSLFFTGAALALLISRMGLQPFGFSHTIIELTAIHFHYSGISVPVFVYYLNYYLNSDLTVHNYIIAFGTPIVALGITSGIHVPIIGLFSVFIFAGDLILLSGLVLRSQNNPSSGSLKVAHSALIIAMLLAIYYATGVALPLKTVSISAMVVTHGILNGLIFVPLSIFCWARLADSIIFPR